MVKQAARPIELAQVQQAALPLLSIQASARANQPGRAGVWADTGSVSAVIVSLQVEVDVNVVHIN